MAFFNPQKKKCDRCLIRDAGANKIDMGYYKEQVCDECYKKWKEWRESLK